MQRDISLLRGTAASSPTARKHNCFMEYSKRNCSLFLLKKLMSASPEISGFSPKLMHIETLVCVSNMISVTSTFKTQQVLHFWKLPFKVASDQALQTHPSLWETNDDRQDLITNAGEEGLPPGQLVTSTVCLKRLGTCNLLSPASSWELEHRQAELAALVARAH